MGPSLPGLGGSTEEAGAGKEGAALQPWQLRQQEEVRRQLGRLADLLLRWQEEGGEVGGEDWRQIHRAAEAARGWLQQGEGSMPSGSTSLFAEVRT